MAKDQNTRRQKDIGRLLRDRQVLRREKVKIFRGGKKQHAI